MKVVPLMATDPKVQTKTPTLPASDKHLASMEANPKDLFIWLILTASQAKIDTVI